MIKAAPVPAGDVPGWAATAPVSARGYGAWSASPWGRYAWRIEARIVLAELAPLDGRRIADVGCGTGRLLPALAGHGVNAVGIDADPAMLGLAAGRGPVMQADAHRLPIADGSPSGSAAT